MQGGGHDKLKCEIKGVNNPRIMGLSNLKWRGWVVYQLKCYIKQFIKPPCLLK